MKEKSFVVPLGSSDRDRYRLYCRTEQGRVAVFSVQYEALIGDSWRAIVRYDTAHQFPHRDLLHPDGSQDKTEYPGYSKADVLTLGQEDIRRHWSSYRAGYERERRQ